MKKRIVNRDFGQGSSYFDGAGVDEFVHSSAVVVEMVGHRLIYCSGITATKLDGTAKERDTIAAPNDIEAQTEQVIRNLVHVLGQAEATLNDVVRVRVYVAKPMDRRTFQQIHEVRARFFDREHYPASTLVVVDGLVRPDAMLEMDADAVVEVDA